MYNWTSSLRKKKLDQNGDASAEYPWNYQWNFLCNSLSLLQKNLQCTIISRKLSPLFEKCLIRLSATLLTQVCVPVGCVPPTCWLYPVAVSVSVGVHLDAPLPLDPPTRCIPLHAPPWWTPPVCTLLDAPPRCTPDAPPGCIPSGYTPWMHPPLDAPPRCTPLDAPPRCTPPGCTPLDAPPTGCTT